MAKNCFDNKFDVYGPEIGVIGEKRTILSHIFPHCRRPAPRHHQPKSMKFLSECFNNENKIKILGLINE